jgi:outer membrane immunogenic protein
MKTVIFAAAAAALLSAAPAFAQDDSFVGPRAEVIAGYDAVKTNSNGYGTPDGFLYGIALGYDLSVGGAVVGLEAELADSTTKYNFTGGSIDASRDIYVGARAGVPLGDIALAYVKAGYTNARFEANGYGSEKLDGLRLGAGLEYKLSTNLFVKGEYRYSNYEQDVVRHQVVGGLGIRF